MADPFVSSEDYYRSFAPPGGTGFGRAPPPRGPGLFGYNASAPTGPIESIAQSVLPMLGEMLRKEFGGAAFQFGGDMNVTSSKYAQQYIEQLNRAREAGSKEDAEQIKLIVAGVARMLGNDVSDPTVKQSIGVLSRDVSGMMPVLASMFPDTIDKMFPRGSMTVAAQSFTSAGRFVIDPATGQPVSTDPDYGPRVIGDLMKQGPKATAGLGAGRVGQLYEQLVSQGTIGSGEDLRQQVLAGTMSGADAQKVQGKDVEDKLKSYSQAIAAINDIFAENGQANRPMAELIRGLQTLTQGGMRSMDAQTLATSVRTAQAITQTTGVSAEVMAQTTGQIQAALVQGGMRGPNAAAIAAQSGGITQYAWLFAKSASDRGLVFGGPEGQSAEELVGRSAAAAAAGQTSDYGRMVGAILSLGKGADEKSPMRALSNAIADPKGKPVVDVPGFGPIDLRTVNYSTLSDIAVASGMDQNAILARLQAGNQIDAAQQEAGAGFNRTLRDKQKFDMERDFANRLVGAEWGQSVSAERPDRMFAAIQEAARDGETNKSDQDVANAAVASMRAQGFHFDDKEPSRLQSLIGTMGGRFAFVTHDDVLADATQKKMEANIDRGKFAAAAAHLMRGGTTRNLTMAVVEEGLKTVGGTDFRDMVNFGLRAFGMVTDEELDRAKLGIDSYFTPLPDTNAGQSNVVRNFGIPLPTAVDKLAPGNRWNLGPPADDGAAPRPLAPPMAHPAMLPAAVPVPGPGAGAAVAWHALAAGAATAITEPTAAPVGPWNAITTGATEAIKSIPRPGDGGVGSAPTKIELKIDIAKIEQVGDRMSISGGGAMRGERTT